MATRTIVPNQEFKHGTETYEEGQSYEVSEGEAYYFEQVGWVGERNSKPAQEAQTLEIQDGVIGHSAEVK